MLRVPDFSLPPRKKMQNKEKVKETQTEIDADEVYAAVETMVDSMTPEEFRKYADAKRREFYGDEEPGVVDDDPGALIGGGSWLKEIRDEETAREEHGVTRESEHVLKTKNSSVVKQPKVFVITPPPSVVEIEPLEKKEVDVFDDGDVADSDVKNNKKGIDGALRTTISDATLREISFEDKAGDNYTLSR